MYIGECEVSSAELSGEKTPGGIDLMKIMYSDGRIEMLSELMYKEIISENACDASQLRDKRVNAIVPIVLAVFREWGVKIGELGYISAHLNRSLDFNKDCATRELWSKWMPTPLSLDDVDMVTVDRVLRSIQPTLNDVLNNDKK